jgi:tetratricopeptide (TPR) repeat protein
LLTGRPAFDGADRQELLRRIAHDEPTQPRRIDPAIPHDLETVVGKAMAKEPERRYATARELADDLGRFLDDRPILARRPGPIDRLRRWSRRHKRATAAALALLVFVSLASAGGMARLWEEQRRTRAALDTARQARRRERQALIFTFTASDQVAARALARIASTGTAEARDDEEFCGKALDYYLEIADRYRDDDEMSAVVAAADHRIGFIRMILEVPGAEGAYRRSIARYERLVAAASESRELAESLALTHYDLSLLLRTTGPPESALDCFPPLLALRQRLAVVFPDETSNLVSLAYMRAEYCGLLEEAGRSAEAGEVRRQFREGSLPIFRRAPGPAGLRNRLAWQLCWRPGSASQNAILAVELAEGAVALDPTAGAYRNTLGVAYYRAGDPKAAAALEESMALRSGGDPYDWLPLAMALRRLGDPAASRRWYERSLGWIRANASRNDELLRFRDEAARLMGPGKSAASETGGDVGLIE